MLLAKLSFFKKKYSLSDSTLSEDRTVIFRKNAATMLESLLYEITFVNRESLEPDKKILCITLEEKANNLTEND